MMSVAQEIDSPGVSKTHAPPRVRTAEPQKHQAHEQHSHEEVIQKPAQGLSWGTILAVMLLAGCSLVGLFFAGWLPRQQVTAQLEHEAHEIKNSLPTVRVTKPVPATPIAVVTLPGDVQAMEEITLFPRTTGYVKRWLVDIGDEVEAGQLIAEIDTPEVRAQYEQSEAALAESLASLERARATVNLAKITTNRLRTLVARKNAAQQDLDDSENNLAVGEANVRLAEATVAVNKSNVQHMQELLSFSRIHSPFEGTVVGRFLETGKLVSSGNGTGQALFRIARTNPVRVFINVPQAYAAGVVKDLTAEVRARDIPGRVFQGVVTRTARAIDPLTRTLLTEIQVPNDDGALLTGSYVQVQMEVQRYSPPLLVPASALIFNSGGTQVAVVGPDNKIELRVIEVAGDIGKQIGIATGISENDQVVINPGDRMSQDLMVELQQDAVGTAD
ncbi:efflux RND transporter periplasmic adaptor subunit [Schlesneria sp. T3-172]|uniref:efflux RND transporter periplasmic adaptor subunit n=1 Tax=Schlesneria sphaerica TaxID=3373610 RepID=UPI0037C825DB